MKQIGLIGVGNMGEALLSGLLNRGDIAKSEVIIHSKTVVNQERTAQKYGVETCANNKDLARQAKIIILAIKPNLYETVIEEIKPALKADQVVVSITPSYTLKQLQKLLPGVFVMRTMPNTPSKVGCGMTGICQNREQNPQLFDEVVAIFQAIGETIIVDEKDFPLVGTLSGSNPAFIEFIVKAMVDFAVSEGLDEATSLRLVLKTIRGTVELIENSSDPLETMIQQVCSKGGSTIRGVTRLTQDRVDEQIVQALVETTNRFKEMESEHA